MGDKFSIHSIHVLVCVFDHTADLQLQTFAEKQFPRLGNKNEKLVMKTKEIFHLFPRDQEWKNCFTIKIANEIENIFNFVSFLLLLGAPSCAPPSIQRRDLPPCRQILMCI